MMAIPIETNPSRDFVLVEIIEKALDRIDQGNITLTVAGAQDALLLLESIYNYNTSDVVVAQKVATLEILVEVQAPFFINSFLSVKVTTSSE